MGEKIKKIIVKSFKISFKMNSKIKNKIITAMRYTIAKASNLIKKIPYFRKKQIYKLKTQKIEFSNIEHEQK